MASWAQKIELKYGFGDLKKKNFFHRRFFRFGMNFK
jgi:hypothetical protein